MVPTDIPKDILREPSIKIAKTQIKNAIKVNALLLNKGFLVTTNDNNTMQTNKFN